MNEGWTIHHDTYTAGSIGLKYQTVYKYLKHQTNYKYLKYQTNYKTAEKGYTKAEHFIIQQAA